MAGRGVEVNWMKYCDHCEVCGGSGIDGDEECVSCMGRGLIPNELALDAIGRLVDVVNTLRTESAKQRAAMRAAADLAAAGASGAAFRELSRALGHIVTVPSEK